MLEHNHQANTSLMQEWQQKIAAADRNNIFYHCRCCGNEWVDSYFDIAYCRCRSSDVEKISCWQFPSTLR